MELDPPFAPDMRDLRIIPPEELDYVYVDRSRRKKVADYMRYKVLRRFSLESDLASDIGIESFHDYREHRLRKIRDHGKTTPKSLLRDAGHFSVQTFVDVKNSLHPDELRENATKEKQWISYRREEGQGFLSWWMSTDRFRVVQPTVEAHVEQIQAFRQPM